MHLQMPQSFRNFQKQGVTAKVTMSLGPVKYLSKFVVRIHLLFLCGEHLFLC